MKNPLYKQFVGRTSTLRYIIAIGMVALLALPAVAQDKDKEKGLQKGDKPSDAEMMAMMMELSKTGENHKLLAKGVGKWTYKLKHWMDPSQPPSESTGVSETKPLLDGRYFISEHNGKFAMPGPDGKTTDMEFKGIGIEGYDNVKKKFVSSWVDNMGTGIMISEGTYDAASKTLTALTECEMMPGMKSKIRQVLKIKDDNNRTLEFFEDRGDGKEVKTMEIAYTRKST